MNIKVRCRETVSKLYNHKDIKQKTAPKTLNKTTKNAENTGISSADRSNQTPKYRRGLNIKSVQKIGNNGKTKIGQH